MTSPRPRCGSTDRDLYLSLRSSPGVAWAPSTVGPCLTPLAQWGSCTQGPAAPPWASDYANGMQYYGIFCTATVACLKQMCTELSSYDFMHSPPPPPGVGCYPCPFCATSVHNLVTHIRTQCPYAYVALFRTACALWHSPAVLRAVHLTDALPCAVFEVRDGLTLCDVHTSQAFGVQLGAAVPQVPPTIAAMAVYSLGGLWYVQSSSQDAPPVTPADQAALMRL